MSQKGKEMPEDIGDTSPMSLLQKGPTLISVSIPTPLRKPQSDGASGWLGTSQGIITQNSWLGFLQGEGL